MLQKKRYIYSHGFMNKRISRRMLHKNTFKWYSSFFSYPQILIGNLENCDRGQDESKGFQQPLQTMNEDLSALTGDFSLLKQIYLFTYSLEEYHSTRSICSNTAMLLFAK